MLAFLAEMEQQQQSFELEDLAEATGYKMSSIRTYYGKRLKQVLVHEQPDGRFTAHGFDVFDDQSFIDYMTQRSAPPELLEEPAPVQEIQPTKKDPRAHLSQTMLMRARDAAIHAINSYHHPQHADRLGGFGDGILRAWTLLLKAEMAQHRGLEGLYPAQHPLRSKPLMALLPTIYPNEKDPVRKNLEWVWLFTQDNAELLFDDIAPYFSRLFQATVLNFRKRFEAMAGQRMLERGMGQLVLLDDSIPPDFDTIRQSYGDFVSSRLHHLLQELRYEESQVQSGLFCVEAGWTLSMYHNAMRQTIELVDGDGPLSALQKLDDDQSTPPHPFDAIEVVQQINALLPYERRITSQAIELIDVVYNVRQSPPNRYVNYDEDKWQYSRSYVHWIARCIRRDETWLQKTRQSYQRAWR